MKPKIILSTMIMIVIETICLFIPYSFQEECWKYDTSANTYHGISTLKYRSGVNVFGISTSIGKLLAVIVIVLMLLSFVAFFLDFLKKENKLTKLAYYTPLISFASLLILSIYACAFAEVETTNWRYTWTINWLFYIIIALHIVAIVFSILLKLKKFELMKVQVVENKTALNTETSFSTADELKKYKELLDANIISQEEFDTKKQQLLGL